MFKVVPAKNKYGKFVWRADMFFAGKRRKKDFRFKEDAEAFVEPFRIAAESLKRSMKEIL